ncbi:MAG: molybdopterin-guanine dinucleotide biosynthesis protein B [Deltaproteobacteria bacterium]|nr:molybdopterin-guanine dinucleotide biosynthesis protein B [Deltaproteobacteria bacterium]
MPPIVSIVGKSESGKTTLLEKLIAELKSRGYRVATVKHAPQESSFDEPGKDSWRHIQAGSEAAVISSSDKLVLIKPLSSEPSFEQIAYLLGEDYDIILAEGFSQGDAPKIEVHRKQSGPLLPDARKLIAIATDEPLETKTRQFSLEDTKGIADLLEKGFLKPQRERLSLYVNHTPIVLTVFPKQIITNILLALASSLKGVKKVKNLDIFYRKP